RSDRQRDPARPPRRPRADRRQGTRAIPGDRRQGAAVRRRGRGARGADPPAEQLWCRVTGMLYHLLYPFHTQLSVLNVTRYITFRTAAASLSALGISLVLGPWMVQRLREFQIGQVIRQ